MVGNLIWCPAHCKCSKDMFWGILVLLIQIFTIFGNENCPSTDDWSQTPINTLATLGCDEGTGFRYRFCESSGEWGNVDDSYCTQCNADDVWPDTRTDYIAYADCGVDTTGIMIRPCNTDQNDAAVWGPIDMKNCEQITSSCLPDDDAWPETRPGEFILISCPSGFTGVRMRYCHGNEIGWANPDDSNCEQDMNTPPSCPLDGIWPNVDSGVKVTANCGNGIDGTQTRLCQSDGSWGEVSTDNCIENPSSVSSCLLDGAWAKSAKNTMITAACPSGFTGLQFRFCDGVGNWLDVDSSNCKQVPTTGTSTCPEISIWPETNANQQISRACPDGFTGTQTRVCSSLNGNRAIWSDVDRSGCLADPGSTSSCPNDGEWPATPIKSMAYLNSCPSGYTGQSGRYCNGGGSWGEVSTDNCIENPSSVSSCLLDGAWAKSAKNTMITAACPSGFTGLQFRFCDGVGNWLDVDSSNCKQVPTTGTSTCPEISIWPETNVNQQISRACPDGFTGTQTRVCSSLNGNGAIWSDVDRSGCFSDPGSTSSCPNDGEWPATPIKSMAYLYSCPSGYTGRRERYCKEDGSWDVVSSSQCIIKPEVKQCPVDGEWKSSPALMTRSMACSSGSGVVTRYCKADGTWGNPNLSHCGGGNHSKFFCSADGIWVQTSIGAKAVTVCSVGYEGVQSRECAMGGIWTEPDTSNCKKKDDDTQLSRRKKTGITISNSDTLGVATLIVGCIVSVFVLVGGLFIAKKLADMKQDRDEGGRLGRI